MSLATGVADHQTTFLALDLDLGQHAAIPESPDRVGAAIRGRELSVVDFVRAGDYVAVGRITMRYMAHTPCFRRLAQLARLVRRSTEVGSQIGAAWSPDRT